MLQRRRFFAENKNPRDDYTFISGIKGEPSLKTGSYIILPFTYTEDSILSINISIDRGESIAYIFGTDASQDRTSMFCGPKLYSINRTRYVEFSYVNDYSFDSQQISNIPVALSQDDITIQNGLLTIGNAEISFSAPSQFELGYPVYLLGHKYQGIVSCQWGIIHEVNFYDGTENHHFVPCYAKNNPRIGLLYDETTDLVYGSATAKPFSTVIS